jgi:hypothetical protein
MLREWRAVNFSESYGVFTGCTLKAARLSYELVFPNLDREVARWCFGLISIYKINSMPEFVDSILQNTNT